MTKIHFYVTAHQKYAEWTCLCLRSLFMRGQVRPDQIVVSLHEMLQDTVAAQVMRKMGVVPRIYAHGEAQWSKILFVDRLFREQSHVTRVLQLDSDCVLTEDMDFIRRVESLTCGAHVMNYVASMDDPVATFKRKGQMFWQGFNPMGSHLDRGRMSAHTEASFGITLAQFEQWLATAKWIHGGFTLYDRQIVTKPVWKALVAFSWTCGCDETAILLAQCSSAFHLATGGAVGHKLRWMPLAQEALPHRVNPPKLDLYGGEGMIHFAGKWYREDREENKIILETAFSQLASVV